MLRCAMPRYFLLLLTALAVVGVILVIYPFKPKPVGAGLKTAIGELHQLTAMPVVPAPHPETWIKLDIGGKFSLYAPPGTTYRPLQGIDSFVGQIRGQGFRMFFDFGDYANDHSGWKSAEGYTEQGVMIDGHPGIIRMAPRLGHRDENGFIGPYFVGLYVKLPSRRRTYFGLSAHWGALGISAGATSSSKANEVRQMYQTVEISD